jgi:hypothetical protein
MSKLEKGTIVNFQGSWGSNIGTLWIQKEGHDSASGIACENAPTVRILAQFVDCIGEGHTVNTDKLKGLEVFFAMDDMGLILDGIVPTEHATPEMWEMYESGYED